MAKKQLATTLELGTIKKLKMLALTLDIGMNDVLELILSEYDVSEASYDKLHSLLQFSKLKGK